MGHEVTGGDSYERENAVGMLNRVENKQYLSYKQTSEGLDAQSRSSRREKIDGTTATIVCDRWLLSGREVN